MVHSPPKEIGARGSESRKKIVGFAGGYFAIEAEEASAFAKNESVLQWNCPEDYLAVGQ